YIAELAKSVFGRSIRTTIREIPERNLVEVRIHSKLVRRIVLEVFGIENGDRRRIPNIVFELNDELKKAFLRGYFNGDAYQKGNAIFVSTISPFIAYGVSTLLKQLDIAHTLTEYTKTPRRRVYRVNLWDAELEGHDHYTIGKIPFEESGLAGVIDEMLKLEPTYSDSMGRTYQNTASRIMARYGVHHQKSVSRDIARRIIEDAERMGIAVPQTLKELVESDLIFLKVKSIEPIKATNGMVYDFSTDSETFLADQILVHNTFPIPTYNITKDFDWNNDKLKPLWEMTAKFGVPYFANFVHSDMKPEDARSMCLHPDEEILVRVDGNVRHVKIGEFIESIARDWDSDGWAVPELKFEALGLNADSLKTEWIPVKRVLRIKTDKLLHIRTEDGKYIKVSPNHIVTVLTPHGLVNKFAKDVEIGDIILSVKKVSAIRSNTIQEIPGIGKLDETWGWLLGFFTADGNYLYSARNKGKLRGIQFTFGRKANELKEHVRQLLDEKGISFHERKDPRWNTDYIYIYNSELAESLHSAGFRKYGRLPDIIFNSPVDVVRAFLAGFFAGDGYEKRRELHINDYELSRDLVMLYAFAGIPTTYRVRESSQVIYEQHAKSTHTVDGRLAAPPIAERVPGWAAKSTYLVPGLNKNRMVGLATLEKYHAETEISSLIKQSDIYPVRVTSVEWEHLDKPIFVYDIELEREHLFVHSLGTVTHNCCRLRLDNRELRKRGGGLFGAAPLTGSIGVVTINMPRIGYLAKNEDEFFRILEDRMYLAHKSLEIKRKVLEDLTERGLYPYSKFYLRSIKKAVGRYWNNHFSTIGLVGMNEMCRNLLGVSIVHPEAREFALKVLKFMREKIADFQAETGNLYNLEATPAEGASYRLARKDVERYPGIKTAGTVTSPYYTNSVHVPVNYTNDIFEV
ncbi:MAG: hypothetical protein DRQ10_08610, partial [Candidatus Hydrothermota bacterium]